MSDVSAGPGWWRASDDKWYPPEAHPNYRPPPPVSTSPQSTPNKAHGQGWTVRACKIAALPLLILAFILFVVYGQDASQDNQYNATNAASQFLTGGPPNPSPPTALLVLAWLCLLAGIAAVLVVVVRWVRNRGHASV